MTGPAPTEVTPGVTIGVKEKDNRWFVILAQGQLVWSWMGAAHARLIADQLMMCAAAIDGSPGEEAGGSPIEPQPPGMRTYIDELLALEEQLSRVRAAMQDALGVAGEAPGGAE